MRWNRLFPELLVAVLACAVFLPPLATLELWDRREEHVAADAVDTLQNSHWLVSSDHGILRLKKPPLTRWLSAVCLAFAPFYHEFFVRLPAGISALATAAMLCHWGYQASDNPRIARRCGLAAGLFFSTNFLVISEMWVISTEPVLTATVTLALYAYWQAERNRRADRSRWTSPWMAVSGTSVGLGLLTKGPIAIVLTSIAIAGYLLAEMRPHRGATSLWTTAKRAMSPIFWGPAVLIALMWAGTILFYYPDAFNVWVHEMSIKVVGNDHRSNMMFNFLPMAAPWIGFALMGVILPWRLGHSIGRGLLRLVWWWAIGNLLMFSLWTGARQPYYLACMPAVCMLAAMSFAHLTEHACNRATSIAQGKRIPIDPWMLFEELQWGLSLGVVLFLPVFAYLFAREWLVPATALTTGVAGIWIANWKQRKQFKYLVLLAAPISLAAFVTGTIIAPEYTKQHSHRGFGEIVTNLALDRDQQTWFLNDLGNWSLDYLDSPDVTEGVWFYVTPTPKLIDGVTELERQVSAATDPLLLVISERQFRLLEEHPGLLVRPLVDCKPVNRFRTLLVEVAKGEGLQMTAEESRNYR